MPLGRSGPDHEAIGARTVGEILPSPLASKLRERATEAHAVGRSNRTYSTIVGLPLIHSAPNRVRAPIGPRMSFSTRLVVQRDLVRDVGQIVEDVLGKPRDISLVLDGDPAVLAHVLSHPCLRPRMEARRVNGPGSPRAGPPYRPVGVPWMSSPGSASGEPLLEHSPLHHRTLEQVLPHEGISADGVLRRLDRVGHEGD